MRLFQYWDHATPPPEVAAWISGFAQGEPEFEHGLFNENTAARFIAEHQGSRHAAAFAACAVPAMQADYFRLCAMEACGGVYIDADHQRLGPLSELIAQAPTALMFTWGPLINNGFLMFRRPRNPFVQACLALATANVEARRFSTEFTSTGPGVVNAVRAVLEPSALPEILEPFQNPVCAPWGFEALVDHARELIEPTEALVESFRAITLINAVAANAWIGTQQPAYKASDRHWLNWNAPIYR